MTVALKSFLTRFSMTMVHLTGENAAPKALELIGKETISHMVVQGYMGSLKVFTKARRKTKTYRCGDEEAKTHFGARYNGRRESVVECIQLKLKLVLCSFIVRRLNPFVFALST